MTTASRLALVLAILTLAACSTTPIQTTDQWGNPKYSLGLEDPVTWERHRLASAHSARVAALSLLSGRFEGDGAENDLTLELERIRDPKVESRNSLLVSLSGRYRGVEMHRSGLLRLAMGSATPSATYFPDYDPLAMPLSKAALRFGDEGPRAACRFQLQPDGEGFTAQTACRRLFGNESGTWKIDIRPESIRLTNRQTGETMRFSKATG